jgi:hypothetical protein
MKSSLPSHHVVVRMRAIPLRTTIWKLDVQLFFMRPIASAQLFTEDVLVSYYGTIPHSRDSYLPSSDVKMNDVASVEFGMEGML